MTAHRYLLARTARLGAAARPRVSVARRAIALGGAVVAAASLAVAVTAPSSSVSSSPALRPASFTDGAPIGVLSTAHAPGGLQVSGYAFDPDAVTTALHTYATVDGKSVSPVVTANLPRADLAAARPRVGADHGFNWKVPVPQGTHTVCVVAQNVGSRGTNHTLGCVRRVFRYNPVADLQRVSAVAGAIRVAGWAYDNDAPTTALDVVASIDGVRHTVVADRSNADVAKAYPAAGADHGFDTTIPVGQGSHQVCVSVTNVGYGSSTSLGCHTVTLSESPVGGINTIAQQSGKLRVRGWAFDPDAPTSPLHVLVVIDSQAPKSIDADRTRTDVAAAHPSAGAKHGFDELLPVTEGSHRVCVTAVNVSYGSNTRLACRTVTINFTPTAILTDLKATATGAYVKGWTSDPDTSAPIQAQLTLDGKPYRKVTANKTGTQGTGYHHYFGAFVTTRSGQHSVCAIGLNVLYGTHNSTPACRTITLALSPVGKFESLTRAAGSTDLAVTGWALDPDTTAPIRVTATLDGAPAGTFTADSPRPDVAGDYPGEGADHGLVTTLTADDGEHTVCLTAVNVSGGRNLALGCKLIDAVHPVAPTAPAAATAVPNYGSAVVSWTAPSSDGGAPPSTYTVLAAPGGVRVTVPGNTLTATVLGLKSNTTYTFSVTATNVAGTSPATVTAPVTTPNGPPPQTTPAPVSTSRYIRNVTSTSAASLAMMRAEGAADGADNPSGHAYVVLLDIGGQDQYDGGVVLSATTRFASYATLVRNIESYLDGYHSTQRSGAPVTVAIGTNNDMDVNRTTGGIWATQMVNPLRSYAQRYPGITLAGANDIEPGFRASYSATRSWLQGYLAATTAPFLFNGSADGCAWTTINKSCNNGWTMAGLDYLAVGAAPTRMRNLPQIYNSTMAAQWKWISLTGVVAGGQRINFAGTLTEATACRQAGGCGSLTGRSAWQLMWGNLQSDSRLKVSSLPYATDLRIDR